MRVLITGYSGQLGYDVYRELLNRGISEDEIYCPTSTEMNLTKESDVINYICSVKPDIIYHCAAYTKVDDAEVDVKKCLFINTEGTKYVTNAAKICDAKVISISSDYVFDGTKDGVYEEKDARRPLNIYGASKKLAENNALEYSKSFVVRTSWVFGINGKNFVKTMISLGEKYKELRVVNDQIGSPTYTVDLAKFLVDLSLTDKYGVYHATNENFCSWAEFAEFILRNTGSDAVVTGVTTDEYYKNNTKTVAERPKNSRLSKDKIERVGLDRLPTWQDATLRYIKELQKTKNIENCKIKK